MCDGYFHEGGLMICTENYTYDEQLKLCNVLKEKFNIEASPIKYMKKYRIFIRKSSMDLLKRLIKPYMLKEFLYKLKKKKKIKDVYKVEGIV
jgi:hypothetical protein